MPYQDALSSKHNDSRGQVMRQVDMVRLDLSTGKAEKTKDCVAEEVPLQISLNDLTRL